MYVLGQLAVVLSLAVLTGCFDFKSKNQSQSSTVVPLAPTDSYLGPAIAKTGLLAASTDPATVVQQDTSFSYTPRSSAAGAVFQITNKPSWATFSTSSGTLSGTPLTDATTIGIIISATAGPQSGSIGPFDLRVASDPLFPYSWALENTGQKSFAFNAGVAGEDIKAREAHRLGYFGTDVLVVVSDTGAENTHPDLTNNFLAGASRNYLNSPGYDGFPGASDDADEGGDHGTSVAGIIAAEGWNGIGSRGVAPKAKLAVFNYLAVQPSPLAIDLDQIRDPQASVFNQSYGYEERQYIPLDADYEAQLAFAVATYRNGKGAVFVKAAGNEYDFYQPDPAHPGKYIDTKRALNANSEGDNNVPYMIVAGAVNASGKHSSYSSPGSNLWICAPGGEFGYNITSYAGTVVDDPAVVTTDVTGASRGYARTGATDNPFENCGFPNLLCDYTSVFNGTSSATPHSSGSVAVLLGANPSLGWRDVKHILAVTADQVDPAVAPYSGPFDPLGYIAIPTWTKNAAGYNFHNLYGFGRINLKKAVQVATANYRSSLGTFQQTVDANGAYLFKTTFPTPLKIPDYSLVGVTNTIAVTSNLIVEAIQITVNVTHPFNGDLGIELISPSGTKSVILEINSALTDTNLKGTLLSNAFYGESSQGNWTIKVLDGAQDLTPPVQNLKGWGINVSGHSP